MRQTRRVELGRLAKSDERPRVRPKPKIRPYPSQTAADRDLPTEQTQRLATALPPAECLGCNGQIMLAGPWCTPVLCNNCDRWPSLARSALPLHALHLCICHGSRALGSRALGRLGRALSVRTYYVATVSYVGQKPGSTDKLLSYHTGRSIASQYIQSIQYCFTINTIFLS